MKKLSNRAKRLARRVVDLARDAPELMPALLWLMAMDCPSELVREYRKMYPSDEELAAVLAFFPAVREILSHKKRLLECVEAIDPLTALRLHGLGVETLVDLDP